MDGDDDVVAVAGQRLVNGIIHNLEHQVVQPSAVRGVANVHARTLAHGFQAFENLDRALAVGLRCACLIGVDRGLEIGTFLARCTVGDMHLIGFVRFVLFSHKQQFPISSIS